MSKPIPEKIVKRFRKFFDKHIRETIEDKTNEAYDPSVTAIYTTIEDIIFAEEFEDIDFDEWEAAAEDDDQYDWLELFERLPEFVFEEEGGPAWHISRAKTE